MISTKKDWETSKETVDEMPNPESPFRQKALAAHWLIVSGMMNERFVEPEELQGVIILKTHSFSELRSEFSAE